MVRKNPELKAEISATLNRLIENPFELGLKTHRLKGTLREYWSCKAGYDMRIVFTFIRENSVRVIYLHTIGTHDQVY